jgi:hypothetical protein
VSNEILICTIRWGGRRAIFIAHIGVHPETNSLIYSISLLHANFACTSCAHTHTHIPATMSGLSLKWDYVPFAGGRRRVSEARTMTFPFPLDERNNPSPRNYPAIVVLPASCNNTKNTQKNTSHQTMKAKRLIWFRCKREKFADGSDESEKVNSQRRLTKHFELFFLSLTPAPSSALGKNSFASNL